MLDHTSACALMLLTAAFPSVATGAPAPLPCAIAATQSIGDLQHLLSGRAVEIVQRASAPGWKKDAHLQALLAPNAEFGLGSGDVGRPMGSGVTGAHALASDMRADSFRYLAWSSIPMQVDACGEHKVTVDFVRTRASEFDSVEFTFRAGLLVSAKGWTHWFVSGPLDRAKG